MNKEQIDKIINAIEMHDGNSVVYELNHRLFAVLEYEHKNDLTCDFVLEFSSDCVNSSDCKPEDFFIMKPMFEGES